MTAAGKRDLVKLIEQDNLPPHPTMTSQLHGEPIEMQPDHTLVVCAEISDGDVVYFRRSGVTEWCLHRLAAEDVGRFSGIAYVARKEIQADSSGRDPPSDQDARDPPLPIRPAFKSLGTIQGNIPIKRNDPLHQADEVFGQVGAAEPLDPRPESRAQTRAASAWRSGTPEAVRSLTSSSILAEFTFVASWLRGFV